MDMKTGGQVENMQLFCTSGAFLFVYLFILLALKVKGPS